MNVTVIISISSFLSKFLEKELVEGDFKLSLAKYLVIGKLFFGDNAIERQLR